MSQSQHQHPSDYQDDPYCPYGPPDGLLGQFTDDPTDQPDDDLADELLDELLADYPDVLDDDRQDNPQHPDDLDDEDLDEIAYPAQLETDHLESIAETLGLLEHDDDQTGQTVGAEAGRGLPLPPINYLTPPAPNSAPPNPPLGITGDTSNNPPQPFTPPHETGNLVDYLSLMVPDEHLPALRRRLQSTFGPETPALPNQFYSAASKWDGNVRLMWGHSCGFALAQLPGNPLQHYSHDQLTDLVQYTLSVGGRITRLDLALDYTPADGADAVGIIERAIRACETGHLCIARRYRPYPEKDYKGRWLGNGISIGTRGSKNGSGRYLRIYDKGLETKTLPVGQWERWEVELTSVVADQAARHLFLDNPTDLQTFQTALRQIALGAVEFRNGTGPRKSRPLCGWYQTLSSNTLLKCFIRKQIRPALERTRKYLKVGRGICKTLAANTGRTVHQVWDDLTADASASTNRALDLLTEQYVDGYCPQHAGGLDYRQRHNQWLASQDALSPRADWDESDYWEHSRQQLAAAVARAAPRRATDTAPRWRGIIGLDPATVDDLPF